MLSDQGSISLQMAELYKEWINPCTGILNHGPGAWIRGIWVLANHTCVNKHNQNVPIIFAHACVIVLTYLDPYQWHPTSASPSHCVKSLSKTLVKTFSSTHSQGLLGWVNCPSWRLNWGKMGGNDRCMIEENEMFPSCLFEVEGLATPLFSSPVHPGERRMGIVQHVW